MWTCGFYSGDQFLDGDPRVFVDMGRPMPDGSSAFLKTRQCFRREEAEVLWRNLLRSGFQRFSAVWGCNAEP